MNILVVGPSWVGDTILSQPLLQLLKQQHPGAQIDYLAPSWTLPLLARMPEVRLGITNPFGHGALQLAARRRLARTLRSAAYDQALVLPNSFKSALIPWFADIPRRTGFRGEARWGLINDLHRLDPARLPQMVQRFAALALPPESPLPEPLPRPALQSSPEQQQRLLARLGLTLEKPVVAFCPGAEFGPAKRWPETHFAALANLLAARGCAVWLIGSPRDHAVAAAIAQASTAVNLCGRTDIAEAADLLAATRLVVTNDSGLMHAAAAVGRPVIALYGSSSPHFTPPLSSDARIVTLGLECSPCFKRECPLGHLKCLKDLEPARVCAEIDFARICA
ncbi:MAG: lipopolysaccharide heptosyltransferase II [Betaproteobacteria bacterium]|nr:lipopolysaccharide heptosyltransferase II [Betaproteobacteria bacterium]MDH5342054.1 lipopolysaccharide heptosyltransferase II [Betaproteobacteria bacterium]